MNAQHHDDIGVDEGLLHSGRDFGSELLDMRWDQGRWAAHNDLRAHFREKPKVRAKHAAVQQIPDDDDFEPRQFLFGFEDREGVEESLRRMLMHPVTGIDDRCFHFPRDDVRRA